MSESAITENQGEGKISGGAVTVSGSLIRHVRLIYDVALEEISSGRVARRKTNGATRHALPAYIVAVAAVEAFANEMFFGLGAPSFFEDSQLWNLPKSWLEKIELGNKLVLIPLILFGQSFSRSTQPYQDMALLIKVRNDLVHYKMRVEPPKYLKDLDSRGISLTAPDRGQGIDYTWPHKLSTTEGVRWAHNTACTTVRTLVSFVSAEHYREILEFSAENFSPISDSYAREWLAVRGIDPDSDHP